MRKPDDSPQATTREAAPHVRSTFWRDGATQCRWADDFRPTMTHEDPVILDLAHHLWGLAKPALESSDEGLSRLTFNHAIDLAASDLFAQADIGIKTLTTAKQVLTEAFDQVKGACELVPIAPAASPAVQEGDTASEPAFVARLDATPPAPKEEVPGQAHLCLSLGDVVLNVDLRVPAASWLYQGYRRLRRGLVQNVVDRFRPQHLGRLGMMTDDRELTIGLRRLRQPDETQASVESGQETTVALRRRRQA